jgi:hypothetical protein
LDYRICIIGITLPFLCVCLQLCLSFVLKKRYIPFKSIHIFQQFLNNPFHNQFFQYTLPNSQLQPNSNPFQCNSNPFQCNNNPFQYNCNPFQYDCNPFQYDRNSFQYDRNPFQYDRNSFPNV